MTRSRWILLLLVLHLLVFAYPLWRIGSWLMVPEWLLLLLSFPLLGSQYLARRHLYVKGRKASRPVAVLRNLIDYTLGVFVLAVLSLLLLEPVFWVWPVPETQRAYTALALISLLVAWGSWTAWRPRARHVKIDSAKLRRSWRVVQLSDVHIGSRSSFFLRYLSWRVNRLQPDLVCITGDLIDQPGIDEAMLAGLRNFDAPIYYVTGNHERYEDFEAIMQRLNNLGLHVLRNEREDVEELSLIGIDDAENRDQVRKGLTNIAIDPQGFNLLLYHKPVGLRDAKQAGIDLMLCGHTHGGQIWPFHLAVKNQFSRHRGLYRDGDTLMYVSEGTGTWGPALRLLSHSEITVVSLNPA